MIHSIVEEKHQTKSRIRLLAVFAALALLLVGLLTASREGKMTTASRYLNEYHYLFLLDELALSQTQEDRILSQMSKSGKNYIDKHRISKEPKASDELLWLTVEGKYLVLHRGGSIQIVKGVKGVEFE